jgi:hypothetical protein
LILALPTVLGRWAWQSDLSKTAPSVRGWRTRVPRAPDRAPSGR